MAISGVEATSALSGAGDADGLAKLADDFDQFLTILPTQLRNQDPLSPMETNEFTTQLVQFSLVEQQIKSNTLLEAQLDNQELDQALAASAFIGKDVELATDTAQLIDGQATWVYDLQAETVLTNVKIVDANTGVDVVTFQMASTGLKLMLLTIRARRLVHSCAASTAFKLSTTPALNRCC